MFVVLMERYYPVISLIRGTPNDLTLGSAVKLYPIWKAAVEVHIMESDLAKHLEVLEHARASPVIGQTAGIQR
jgi:hypothetical protein